MNQNKQNIPAFPTINHRSLHMDESKLEQRCDLTCPFCGSTNRQQVYTLQENPMVLLMSCNACHAVSASRMPTDEALEDYYSRYYNFSSSRVPTGQITFDGPHRLAKNLSNMYCRYQGDAPVLILDFGGGDGTISHLTAMKLVERGVKRVNIKIVEYNKHIVRTQDSRIVIDRVSSLADISSPFGFVIASAVIEHYPRPRSLLRDLLQYMEKGGIFYARTPYMLPMMKLMQGIGMKVDFTYPAHLHDLGQAFWEDYFTKELYGNFQILKSRPSIVETTLRKHPLRTIAALLFKTPWYLLGKSYKYVGGWEVFVRKTANEDIIDR